MCNLDLFSYNKDYSQMFSFLHFSPSLSCWDMPLHLNSLWLIMKPWERRDKQYTPWFFFFLSVCSAVVYTTIIANCNCRSNRNALFCNLVIVHMNKRNDTTYNCCIACHIWIILSTLHCEPSCQQRRFCLSLLLFPNSLAIILSCN